MIRYVIGIDPGKNTGVAVWDCAEHRMVELETMDFWDAIDYVDRWSDTRPLVVVEVPNTKAVFHGGAKNLKTAQRMGVNVGSVIREAELIYEGLRRRGMMVDKTPPKGKVDAEYFTKATGWTGKSNAHTRDAGMLAYTTARRESRASSKRPTPVST